VDNPYQRCASRFELGRKYLEDSDEALMQRIAVADRTAFRSLLERHARRALSLARHTVGHAGEAEDIVQEAFVRVWQHASRFDSQRALFTTWLHRIVVNLCLDTLRRPRHDGDEGLDEVADDAPDALNQALTRERRTAVHGALRRLPMRQRAALILFHFQGTSARECAASMELSDKAFESLLIRARSALKDALREYMQDDKEPR
jgi:RNA polymerase sigma-70 factor, ECF subfamily